MITDRTAANINILSEFLGMRDVPELTLKSVKAYFGGKRADVMVLFGGSIKCGGDLLAEAMRDGIAERYIIAGGVGHTTQKLRDVIRSCVNGIDTDGMPEAVVFDRYISSVYGLHADYLETESTNCGNNVTNLLRLLDETGTKSENIIICQDSSMQRRMDAGMRKYCAAQLKILNFSVYMAKVAAENGSLLYENRIDGMWDIERYIELIMGEIPRLRDDGSGYGPNGKDFIAHVDIPEKVDNAYLELSDEFGIVTRYANPAYAGADVTE